MKVYLAMHFDEGDEDVILLGAYSTLDKAVSALPDELDCHIEVHELDGKRIEIIQDPRPWYVVKIYTKHDIYGENYHSIAFLEHDITKVHEQANAIVTKEVNHFTSYYEKWPDMLRYEYTHHTVERIVV